MDTPNLWVFKSMMIVGYALLRNNPKEKYILHVFKLVRIDGALFWIEVDKPEEYSKLTSDYASGDDFHMRHLRISGRTRFYVSNSYFYVFKESDI